MSASKIFIIELMVDEITEIIMPHATRAGIKKMIEKYERMLVNALKDKNLSAAKFAQKRIGSCKKALSTALS